MINSTRITLFTSISVVTLFIITFMLFHAHHKNINYINTIKTLNENIYNIVYYDEVLTMSAYMATSSGHEKWLERYHSTVPKLKKSIEHSLKIAPEITSSFENIAVANQILITLEMKSFSLLSNGKKEEAFKLLTGSEYVLNKQKYQQAINTIKNNIKIDNKVKVEKLKHYLFIVIFVILLTLVLIIIFARYSLNNLKNHNEELTLAKKETDKAMERFNEIMLATEDGIWDWNIVTGEVYYSPAWQTMLGYEVGEIAQVIESWKELIHPYDLDMALDHATKFITNESNLYHMEFRMLCKDSSYKWVLARAKDAERDEKGQVTRIIGTHVDIQERKTYEKELELAKQETDEAMERFNEVMLATEDGIWDWNIVTGEVYYSPAWQTMLGYKVGEIAQVIESWNELIHPDDLDMALDHATKFITNESNLYHMEFRMLCKDSSYKWVLARAKDAERDEKGQITRIIGTHVDIQKKKKLEFELIQAKEEAEIANLSKSTFLANMSHEIRTPLNAIMGFIDLLKEEEQDKDKLKYLKTVDTSSTNLLEIINDILDFSKIEANQIELEYRDYNTVDEFDSITELFTARVLEKNITFNIDIDKKLPLHLNSDALRIKQVIINLLSNAVKFTSKDKTIYLKVEFNDEKLSVSVKDEGIGIAQDKLRTIFEPFTQADNSTTREFGGTGLGLTISSNLILALKGELKVKSEIGIGSEFYFSIPVKTVDVKPLETKVQTNDIKLSGHILLVEDNTANQMFMKIILKKIGLTFDIAFNGLEAIERFPKMSCENNKTKYDVILMDENMPNMNGIEATKRILEIEKEFDLPHTPIIALTANALKGDRQRFLDAGMDYYMTKPINKKKLASVLHEIIKLQK